MRACHASLPCSRVLCTCLPQLVLMYWHNFHRSDLPVYFAISYEVFVCVFYFVAAYVTNMGAAPPPPVRVCTSLSHAPSLHPERGAARRSVRAYVNYVLVWRSIEVAGLITSLLVFSTDDNFAQAYAVVFLLTEIVGACCGGCVGRSGAALRTHSGPGACATPRS